MYTLSQLFNWSYILYNYLYIFVMNILFEYGEGQLTEISHYLQVLWLSRFNDNLNLSLNQQRGTLTTEIGNMKRLCKLMCTHCLTLTWILYFLWSFVYLCYAHIIWIWRVLTDRNISLPENIVTLSFKRVAVYVK